tara:strand:- start:2244 stop:2684 length:441 start_codon:yes stop_codon:yes gene_type:complete
MSERQRGNLSTAIHAESRLDHRLLLLIKLLNTYLNHFPKHEKYGLCLQIRNAAYDTYGLVIEAQKRHYKKTALTQLDIRHEQLRMLVRLAYEMGYFAFKNGALVDQAPEQLAERRYHAVAVGVDDVGRLIGGWIGAVMGAEPRKKQ